MRDAGTTGLGADWRALFDAGLTGGLTDGQLLGRFVDRGDEAAFEALARRHGGMVRGVCRRILGAHHDAEDAEQAAWIVLARKARSVRGRDEVGPWLHGVAVRASLKAREARARRRRREGPAADLASVAGRPPSRAEELRPAIDEALGALPEAYRAPIVLCDLGGLGHREAADRLGWPVGTVSGRLWRGRRLLADRLRRAGSALAAAAAIDAVARESRGAVEARGAIESGARLAARFIGGRATGAGTVPARVLALTREVQMVLILSKIRAAACVALPIGLLAAGVGLAAGMRPAAEAPIDHATPPGVDPSLAKAAPGRIVRAPEASKDAMVLAYIPNWGFGLVDNIGVEDHDGGVRTLVDWPAVPPDEAAATDRAFYLAVYARKATAAPNPGPLAAFEVESDWPEPTSWVTQPKYAPEPAARFRFEPGEGWKLLDVTPLVRARAKEGRAAKGIVLKFLDEGHSGNGGWSGYQLVSREGADEWANRRPRLLVVEPPAK